MEIFGEITDYPAALSENVVVNRFKRAAMSGGAASTEFWSGTATPILIQRYESSLYQVKATDIETYAWAS